MMVRKVFFISFLLIIVSSCSNKGFKKISNDEKPYLEVFSDDFNKVIYKSNFVIYGNELSGITIFKRTNSSIRVVSMSELGIKYFDMEFFPNASKEPLVHYMMDVLNRKMLVKRLISDLNLIFNFPSENISRKTDRSKELLKSGNYHYSIQSDRVFSINTIKFPGGTKRIISMDYNGEPYPKEIRIRRSKILLVFKQINSSESITP